MKNVTEGTEHVNLSRKVLERRKRIYAFGHVPGQENYREGPDGSLPEG